MIAIFTDFGCEGPYTGQMEAVIAARAPGIPTVRLQSDAPRFDPRASAYLLAALVAPFPPGTVFLAVVDPGVGSARRALALEADGRRFVGPDNGLLEIAARRAADPVWWEIDWRPESLSASFHGRDLFAPVAARLAMGHPPQGVRLDLAPDAGLPDELFEVIYVDAYGNAVTGVRAATLAPGARFSVNGRRLARARTFSDAAPGELFWYENALGLAELAANRASAAGILGLEVGVPVGVSS